MRLVRKLITCECEHPFMDVPGELLQGTEILMAVAADAAKADQLLSERAHEHRWTKSSTGGWRCQYHADGK